MSHINDQNWLKEQIERGETSATIAKLLDINPSTVQRRMKRFGINMVDNQSFHLKNKEAAKFLNDENWLKQKYVTENLGFTKISDLIGVNRRTVKLALKRFGIELAESGGSKMMGNPEASKYLNDTIWMYDRYITKDLPSGTIAKEIGVTARIVLNYLKKHGIEKKNPWKRSRGEQELKEFVAGIFGGRMIFNDRKVIKPYEIDILIPSISLAIEYHGDYWHANPKWYDDNDLIRERYGKRIIAKDKWEKDEKKKIMLERADYTLLVVWDNEWNINKEIVKNSIKTLIEELWQL